MATCSACAVHILAICSGNLKTRNSYDYQFYRHRVICQPYLKNSIPVGVYSVTLNQIAARSRRSLYLSTPTPAPSTTTDANRPTTGNLRNGIGALDDVGSFNLDSSDWKLSQNENLASGLSPLTGCPFTGREIVCHDGPSTSDHLGDSRRPVGTTRTDPVGGCPAEADRPSPGAVAADPERHHVPPPERVPVESPARPVRG